MPDNAQPDPMARLADVVGRSKLSVQAAEQSVVRRYGSATRITPNPLVAAAAAANPAQAAPPVAPPSAPAGVAPRSTASPTPTPTRNPFSAFVRRAAGTGMTVDRGATPAAPAQAHPVTPAPSPASHIGGRQGGAPGTATAGAPTEILDFGLLAAAMAERQAATSPAAPPAKRSAFSAFAASITLPDSDDSPPDAQASSAPSARGAPAVVRSGGLQRAAAPERKKVNYSDEQLGVMHSQASLIVADAGAGSGKTTTAVGFAEARPNQRVLYICVGTENAAEARRRFPRSNTTCLTTHAVARAAIKPAKERVTDRWKPMVVQDLLNVTPREASLSMKVLAEFFNSSDVGISMYHVEIVNERIDMTTADRNTALSNAKLMWMRMQRENDKMLMPHDAYLKMFALRAPVLPYDAVIFDEAQDANPVTLQILQGQKSIKQMLCIGDRHQGIFGFRGAMNAMEILGAQAERHFLSESYRFGPKIANLANLLLGELKGEHNKIKGLGKDGTWDESKVAHLTRTNAQLFRLAAGCRGAGVHWVGGIEKYRVGQVMDAYHLFARERDQVSDPLMKRKFQHWDEYVNYAEDASDAEAKILVKIVDDFKHDTPDLVADLKCNAVEHAKDASLTLTTAHRSKGLEFDNVRIGEDFELLAKAEEALADNAPQDLPTQDINLLYVALTRTKNAVQLNPEFQGWLDKLPVHRQDRAAAAARHEASLQRQRAAMRAS